MNKQRNKQTNKHMFVNERMKERTFSIALMVHSYSDETGSCTST